MQPSPHAALLNEPQRRHLGVTLSQIQRLLHDTMAMLERPPAAASLVTETDDLRDLQQRLRNLLDVLEATS